MSLEPRLARTVRTLGRVLAVLRVLVASPALAHPCPCEEVPTPSALPPWQSETLEPGPWRLSDPVARRNLAGAGVGIGLTAFGGAMTPIADLTWGIASAGDNGAMVAVPITTMAATGTGLILTPMTLSRARQRLAARGRYVDRSALDVGTGLVAAGLASQVVGMAMWSSDENGAATLGLAFGIASPLLQLGGVAAWGVQHHRTVRAFRGLEGGDAGAPKVSVSPWVDASRKLVGISGTF